MKTERIKERIILMVGNEKENGERDKNEITIKLWYQSVNDKNFLMPQTPQHPTYISILPSIVCSFFSSLGFAVCAFSFQPF